LPCNGGQRKQNDQSSTQTNWNSHPSTHCSAEAGRLTPVDVTKD